MFGRKKKSAAISPPVHTSGSEAPAAVLAEIDALSDRWKGGDGSAQTELWNLVLRLPAWHFIARGRMEDNSVRPFIGVQPDGTPMLHAYTSAERAHEGRSAIAPPAPGENPADGDAYATLQMPPEAAIRAFAPYALQGVAAMLFDDPRHGFFTLLPNLPGMYEQATGKAIDDLVLPPAPGEMAHLASRVTGAPEARGREALTRYVIRTLHLPQIHLLMNAADPTMPCLFGEQQAMQLCAISSADQGRDALEWVQSKGGDAIVGPPMPTRKVIEYFKSLQDNGLKGVFLDPGKNGMHVQTEMLVGIWGSMRGLAQRHRQAESLLVSGGRG